MKRWTRSKPIAHSIYLEKDVLEMWHVDQNGLVVTGKDDPQSAYHWAAVTLKPTDIFQLDYLVTWLAKYSCDHFQDCILDCKFGTATFPLRERRAEYYGKAGETFLSNTWYWSATLERSWESLKFSVRCRWQPPREYAERVKFADDVFAMEWNGFNGYASDSSDNDLLSPEYWTAK